MMNLLKDQTMFAGYKVVGKMSRHHDGEREVYHVVDENDNDIVLTVYVLTSERYANNELTRKRTAISIDEIRFMKENGDMKGVADYIDSGVCQHEGLYLAWMTQKFVEGVTLETEIRRRDVIPFDFAVKVFACISNVVAKVAQFTHGGGHYNISIENIFVDYAGSNIINPVLIGFSNLGSPCSGRSQIDNKCLDRRFCAQETFKGIFNHLSDIYSLGMVMWSMLVGLPDVVASDFRDALVKLTEGNLKNSMKLILRKATHPSPGVRFTSIGKFQEIIGKHSNNEIKTATVVEKDSRTLKEEKVTAAPAKEIVVKKHGLDEVAGMADLKALFRRDFISIVKSPKLAEIYGIKPSNCMLLYGPQGCGKTFIAERAAQESGLEYKIVHPSDLGSIYIHGAQEKIAAMFDEAEQKGPMILIFDEFDALVPNRDGHCNENQAGEVNEILTQLNNCAERGIYVIATTNRPTLLDPACLRTGRIDRKIYVSLPDFEARKELFKLELHNRPVEQGIDYEKLAMMTDNYTCSDISFIVKEVARKCFEETIAKELADPVPISMAKIMDVTAVTGSSVSESQRREFMALREKMKSRESYGRRRVGYTV